MRPPPDIEDLNKDELLQVIYAMEKELVLLAKQHARLKCEIYKRLNLQTNNVANEMNNYVRKHEDFLHKMISEMERTS